MDGSLAIHTAEFLDMTAEAFELGEEIRFAEVAVEDADGVALVQGSDEAVPPVLARFHVVRGDAAGGAEHFTARSLVKLRLDASAPHGLENAGCSQGRDIARVLG